MFTIYEPFKIITCKKALLILCAPMTCKLPTQLINLHYLEQDEVKVQFKTKWGFALVQNGFLVISLTSFNFLTKDA